MHMNIHHCHSKPPFAHAGLTCVAALALLLGGCAGHDALPDGAETESIEVDMQAYSDSECRAAGADANVTVSGILFSNQWFSPTTYSNPKAFKSYIWDVRRSDFAGSSDLYTTVNLVNVPSTLMDTQAECEAISLNRRVYLSPPTPAPGSMISESFARGRWVANPGECKLPRHFGPDMKFPESFGSNETVRVCVSARDANGNTIAVRLGMSGTRGIMEEVFQNPKVRVNQQLYPVAADQASGDMYCKLRLDSGIGVASTVGTCERAYASWNDLTGWRIGFVSTAQPCRNVWSGLSCRVP
jgi:hypothetical protein